MRISHVQWDSWLVMAVLGNAVGGVGLLSLLDSGQVETSAEEPREPS